MAIATTTALLIGAGLSAGASAYGAHKASGAAKDAAETQADASTEAARLEQEGLDKSLELQRQTLDFDLRRSQPYDHTGAYAMGALGHLTGAPPMPAYQSPFPASGVVPQTTTPTAAGGSANDPSMVDRARQALEQSGTPPPTRGNASPGMATLGALGNAPPLNRSSYVRMQAPSGEVQDIPPDRVAFYEQRGARRL